MYAGPPPAVIHDLCPWNLSGFNEFAGCWKKTEAPRVSTVAPVDGTEIPNNHRLDGAKTRRK